MIPPPPTPTPAPLPTSVADSTGTSGSRSASRLAASCADALVHAHAPPQSKKAAPASLKRVEALLLDGEKLTFEITKVGKYTELSQIDVGMGY